MTDRIRVPELPSGIREATPDDAEAIVALITELAVYERAGDQVEITPERLHAVLFAEAPQAWCLVAERHGEVVGMALWFLNFSTWTGTHGVYLEDLVVRESARGSGLGTALLRSLAAIAVENGFRRFEWSVLDWNAPSIGFYRSLGALPNDEWTTWRLSGDALARAAAR